MRIVALMENTTCREDLSCEHGLSLYIETGNKRILFDAGQSDTFAENAQKLGVDLTKVDIAVLSHGHYDHGGGFARFLELNQTAPVYLQREAFAPHYNAVQKYIGLDIGLQQSGRLIFADEDVQLAPGIVLYVSKSRAPQYPVESYGLSVLESGTLYPDVFNHEQYLLIEENGKRICISGCSHKGILNIMEWFRPDILVGGFHFMKLNPDGDGAAALENAAQELLRYNATYYTGHCTGEAQFVFLKERMGEHLHSLSTGTVMEL